MDLRVFLKLDGSGFQQGITQARASVNNFAEHSLGGLKGQIAAAFTVGALVQFTRKTIEFASHMRDVADALGVNVEWLQKMANSAAKAGANVDDLSKFMTEMNRNRVEAAQKPGGDKALAFKRLGIEGSDLQLPTQDIFQKITEAFRNGSTVALEADAQEVGGKAGRQLLSAFSQGLNAVGPAMSEALIDQLDTLDDAFYSLKITLMTDFAPAIIAIVDKLKWFVNQFRQVGTVAGGVQGVIDSLDIKGLLLNKKEAYDRLKKGLEGVAQETVSQDAEQQNEADAAIIANREARERRRQREGKRPEIPPSAGAPESAKKLSEAGNRITSDSLVQVGNFLGSRRGLIDDIAKETNLILREHTKLLASINSAVSTRATGGSLAVPPVV